MGEKLVMRIVCKPQPHKTWDRYSVQQRIWGLWTELDWNTSRFSAIASLQTIAGRWKANFPTKKQVVYTETFTR